MAKTTSAKEYIKLEKTQKIEHDYTIKYIIIGNEEEGKSNIILNYTRDTFKGEYQITIEA